MCCPAVSIVPKEQRLSEMRGHQKVKLASTMWPRGRAKGQPQNSPGVGIAWGALALVPSVSSLAGPDLFFILGREGQVGHPLTPKLHVGAVF